MLKQVEFYYFSPTGGTKKVGETFAKAFAEEVKAVDLGTVRDETLAAGADIIIAAVPVFGGRVPSIATKQLKKLNGAGKKAVTLAVYGVRAYEDALLELNETLTGCGFDVIASGAFIAQHSMVPSVGAGRPDEKDMAELKSFAEKVTAKLDAGNCSKPEVPGNHPYKDEMAVALTPICTEDCTLCGACEGICPTEAIRIEDGKVVTELEKCIDCLACVAACPAKARCLAPAHQEKLNKMLGSFAEVYRENEVFI